MAALRRRSQELQARRAQKEELQAKRERALADAWRCEKAERTARAKEARRQHLALWRERKEQPVALNSCCEPTATITLSSTDDVRDLSEASRTSPRRSERGQVKPVALSAAADSMSPQRYRMSSQNSAVSVSPRLQGGAATWPPAGAASGLPGRSPLRRRGEAAPSSEAAAPPPAEAAPPAEASRPPSPRRRGSQSQPSSPRRGGSQSPRVLPGLPPLRGPASAREAGLSRRDAAAPGTPVHNVLSELTEQRENNRKDRLRREQQKLLDESAVVAYKDYMRNHFRKILALAEMSANEFPHERRAIGNLGKPLTPQQEKLAATQDSGRPRRMTYDGGAEVSLSRISG